MQSALRGDALQSAVDMGPDEPTTLQSVTLIIAIAGFVLSVTALIWQFVSWWLGGARVEVELTTREEQPGDPQGSTDFVITARNKGRAAVSVSTWGLIGANGFRILPEYFDGPDERHSILGLHHTRWLVRKLDVQRDAADAGERPQDWKAFVVLGTGKRVASNGTVRF